MESDKEKESRESQEQIQIKNELRRASLNRDERIKFLAKSVSLPVSKITGVDDDGKIL